MTTLFAEVIERKNRELEARDAKFARKKEVHALFQQVIENHREELERYFKISSYSNYQVDIRKHRSSYKYSAAFDSIKEYINIGFEANTAQGKHKIPFKYTDNNSKLVGIFKNVLKLLVKEAL